MAKPNCKKCYGKGHLGFNTITYELKACKCLKLPPINPNGTLIKENKTIKPVDIPSGLDLKQYA